MLDRWTSKRCSRRRRKEERRASSPSEKKKLQAHPQSMKAAKNRTVAPAITDWFLTSKQFPMWHLYALQTCQEADWESLTWPQRCDNFQRRGGDILSPCENQSVNTRKLNLRACSCLESTTTCKRQWSRSGAREERDKDKVVLKYLGQCVVRNGRCRFSPWGQSLVKGHVKVKCGRAGCSPKVVGVAQREDY